MKLAGLMLLSLFCGCAGKYIVNTYPAGAKVYIKDIQTKDRKLVGLSPVQINEESKLGDVFFLELEKDNYQLKSVMVKVNAGESLTLSARLDPVNPDKLNGDNQLAKNDEKKDQPQSKPPEEKKKDWQAEIDDLKLRVALLENTTSIQKDAIFSARFKGGPAGFDRDTNERMVGMMFDVQQAIMKGNYEKANELVDKSIQMDEYSSHAWLLKGSIAYLKKDYPEARRAWERTLKIDPYNKPAYQYLSETYKRLGLKEMPSKGPDTRYPASQIEIESRKKIK
jgi:tetratricopeptide (TPR) repeat protein